MKIKRLAAVLLVIALGFSQFSVALADKKSDAQEKKKEAEENLDKKNKEIEEIEKQQEQIQSEIDQLDAELVQVMIDLSTLEEELAVKEDELAETRANLEQAKIDEENQYQAMKKRIQFMYENGNSTLLSSILESDNISDLINRVEYFNEIYSYDRDLLTAYQETKEQVAALEQQQQDEVTALEETRVAYEAKAVDYQNMIASKEESMDGFDSLLKQAQQLASEYQNTISAQNTIIANEEAREAQERAAQEAAAAAAAAANQNNNTGGGSSSNGGGSTGGGSSSNGGSSTGGGQSLNPGYSTNVSGSDVVAYAMTFVGNPYVWGGKDPNTGADCSGFTSYVYAHFGINIPSYSYSQRSVGKEVSYENAQPGDLICYAGHVAIYMGNGKIVHAKGTAYGIVGNDNATYRPIITVRRVL